MPKYDLETVANLQNEASFVAAYNANLVIIENALDDALFRQGDGAASDNALQGDLDMNSKRILNLPAPASDLEPARHGDTKDLRDAIDGAETAQTAAEAAQTAAEAAQTAAETAETNAETAETNAETAQTAAETARDEAIASNASGALTVHDRGTLSSGTETPEPADGAMQKAVNNGAHTLAAPTNTGYYVLTYTNGASAGIITTSNFDVVTDGDTAREHVVQNSIVEYAAYNDGVSNRLIVTLIEDAT